MINKRITIIGIGNMGHAISMALLNKKIILKDNLTLSNRNIKNIDFWNRRGVNYLDNNLRAIKKSDIIILAIKPQDMIKVLNEIKNTVSTNQILISIAAGIKIQTIKNIIKKNQPIIRAMPNICTKVNQSMTCWVKNNFVTKDHMRIVKKIFESFGKQIQLKNENLINQITSISGCGPAYLYYLIEMMENNAIKFGINKDLSKILVMQTMIGSLKLLQQSSTSIYNLRKSVTSKGGMTEAAFQILYKNHFQDIFSKAIQAAVEKGNMINS